MQNESGIVGRLDQYGEGHKEESEESHRRPDHYTSHRKDIRVESTFHRASLPCHQYESYHDQDQAYRHGQIIPAAERTLAFFHFLVLMIDSTYQTAQARNTGLPSDSASS